MKITAVIMCSGLSRRMGDNKLLMLFRAEGCSSTPLTPFGKRDFGKP